MTLAQELTPEDIGIFRNDRYAHSYAIPELSGKRKLTDVVYLIVFVSLLIALITLIAFSAQKSDLARITKGYDNCGNVCGKQNKAIDGIPCSGRDFTNQIYLDLHTLFNHSCIENCTHRLLYNRCYTSNEFEMSIAFWINLIMDKFDILIGLCLVGLGLSVFMVLLFRFLTAVYLWVVLVCTLIVSVAISIYFWIGFLESDDFTYPAILVSIICLVVVIVVVIWFTKFKYILFVLQLTVSAMWSMPLVWLEPILPVCLISLSFIAFFGTTCLMFSAGTLKQDSDYSDKYEYNKSPEMISAIVLNFLMFFLSIFFIIAFQKMVIAGSISAKFFSRVHSRLGSPILRSIYNTIRYHLGSLVLGSLISVFLKIFTLRYILMRTCFKLLTCMCGTARSSYAASSASVTYTEIAIHGQPYTKSSVRGFILADKNGLIKVVKNNVGTFSMNLGKIVVTLATVGVGVLMTSGINGAWIIISIGAFYTFICSHCIFVLIEMGLDLVVISYCENQTLNDDNKKSNFIATTKIYDCINLVLEQTR